MKQNIEIFGALPDVTFPSGSSPDLLSVMRMDLLEKAVQVLEQRFGDDPLMCWLFPDPATRQEKTRHLFRYRVRMTMGVAYLRSDTVEAFTVFEEPGSSHMSLNWRELVYGVPLLLRIGMTSMRRLLALNDFLVEERHALNRRLPGGHGYIDLLATGLEHRGHGHGAALIQACLARADAARLPVYLETYDLKKVTLYSSYGFKLLDEKILPGSSIIFYRMLREPI